MLRTTSSAYVDVVLVAIDAAEEWSVLLSDVAKELSHS